jgi:UDP:flavonoid glycosyltransferase YjiC (YdhE family)
MKEAMCSAIPVIYMPLFAEQTHNAILGKRMGLAENINKHTVTKEKMLAIVSRVLTDPKYKRNAEKYQRIFVDRPIPSLEEGVFWVNRVMKRNHRMPTFKRKGAQQTFWETFFLREISAITILSFFVSLR